MMMDKWMGQLAPFSALPLRLVVGVVMMAHGSQKLFGWFGGPGLKEFAGFLESNLHMAPGMVFAILGGGGEFFGGLLVFLGLFTRFGALLVAAAMAVAVFKVHFAAGLFASNNGFEYPLTLLAAALSLFFSGGQALSLDSVLKIQLKK